MGEDEIRRLIGDVPIYRYPELASMKTPDELFKGKRAAVLLFLTKGDNDGHWLCVLDHPSHIEVFDSFGTKIDGDRAWLDEHEKLEFHEVAPLLSNLLKGGTKQVIHNTTKLQDDNTDTCGDYVCYRILNAHVPLHEFVKRIKSSDVSPDEYVATMIDNIKKRG